MNSSTTVYMREAVVRGHIKTSDLRKATTLILSLTDERNSLQRYCLIS